MSIAEPISLRIATMDDAKFLLAVRNDPLTRAMSRHTHELSDVNHLYWLQESLAAKTRFLYVAVMHGVAPVGTGRLDFNAHDIDVSLAVHPEHRGQGFGLGILRRLCQVVDGTSGLPMHAEVNTKNVPSVLAFLRAGFEPCEVTDDHNLLVEGLNSGRRWLQMRRERQG